MFDYHMHTKISYDGISTADEMVKAAAKANLKEICFTDHLDYSREIDFKETTFKTEDYNNTYDNLKCDGLVIRHGIEFGLTTWNKEQLEKDLKRRHFDFVLGSVHFVNEKDPYYEEYWQGKTVKEAFRLYLEETLKCVKVHDNFDVLGHLTYVCKSAANPTHEPLLYKDYREISDEILKVLVSKGKGMEINTSGVTTTGDFLPPADFLRRFKELGGEIVTVGSDAHSYDRVGKNINDALQILKEIFGHVCTYKDRQPIFHRL